MYHRALSVCSLETCRGHLARACSRTLPCGHPCAGIREEANCVGCLQCTEGLYAHLVTAVPNDVPPAREDQHGFVLIACLYSSKTSQRQSPARRPKAHSQREV